MVRDISLGVTIKHITLGVTSNPRSLGVYSREGFNPIIEAHLNAYFFGDSSNYILFGDLNEVLYGT